MFDILCSRLVVTEPLTPVTPHLDTERAFRTVVDELFSDGSSEPCTVVEDERTPQFGALKVRVGVDARRNNDWIGSAEERILTENEVGESSRKTLGRLDANLWRKKRRFCWRVCRRLEMCKMFLAYSCYNGIRLCVLGTE